MSSCWRKIDSVVPFLDSDEDRIKYGNVNPKDSLSDKVLTESKELLIGFKSMGLSNYGYKVFDKNDPGNVIEDQWQTELNIQHRKNWHQRQKSIFFSRKDTTSLVTTGTVRNVVPDISEPIPFISFRGTQSKTDLMRDAQSITKVRIKSKHGKVIGYTGKGFREVIHAKYRADFNVIGGEDLKVTKDIYEELVCLMERFPTGLIVTGHSLGGAAASCFMADFAIDHADLLQRRVAEEGKCIGVHCVTFGSPRVFDFDTKKAVEALRTTGGANKQELYSNTRYTNDGDVVAAMPKYDTGMYYHVGVPIAAKESESVWYKLPEASYHNFAMDIWKGLGGELSDFVWEEAATHRLGTKTGYTGKFLYNENFVKVVEALPDGACKTSLQRLKDLFEAQVKKNEEK